MTSFDDCPNPLKGQNLRGGTMGTSPLVYVDTHRMIHRDEDGNPKGVNSGVFKTIAKMLVIIILTNNYS